MSGLTFKGLDPASLAAVDEARGAALANMPNPHAFLRVPGAWLNACGFGKVSRVFPVIQVDARSDWFTFAVVDASSVGGSPRWVVHVKCRGAEFQAEGEPAPVILWTVNEHADDGERMGGVQVTTKSDSPIEANRAYLAYCAERGYKTAPSWSIERTPIEAPAPRGWASVEG